MTLQQHQEFHIQNHNALILQHKPVTLQVDASMIGLGAAILQEDEPVPFASKALTNTEQCWANIKCEAYALVFGCE